MLLVQIKSLAECNLSREPQLLESKQKIIELSETGEELTKVMNQKMQELSKLPSFSILLLHILLTYSFISIFKHQDYFIC